MKCKCNLQQQARKIHKTLTINIKINTNNIQGNKIDKDINDQGTNLFSQGLVALIDWVRSLYQFNFTVYVMK